MEPWLVRLLGWIKRSPRRLEVMVGLCKPRLYCELKDFMKLSKNDKIEELKELNDKHLLMCMTPSERKGRLYGLTRYGRRIRKDLLDSLSENERAVLEEKLGMGEIKQDYRESKDIKDWEPYALITVSRKQLRPLLEVLSEQDKSVKQIDSEFQEKTGKILSAGTLNCFLRRLVRLKAASRKEEGRKVFYRATDKGMTIKRQLEA